MESTDTEGQFVTELIGFVSPIKANKHGQEIRVEKDLLPTAVKEKMGVISKAMQLLQ
jgi:hypothetical protein